jgi:serine/threonine protein phosphatase PrpC
MMSEREIADHMRRAPLEHAGDKLVELALARGAPDNVTAVLVNVDTRTSARG